MHQPCLCQSLSYLSWSIVYMSLHMVCMETCAVSHILYLCIQQTWAVKGQSHLSETTLQMVQAKKVVDSLHCLSLVSNS